MTVISDDQFDSEFHSGCEHCDVMMSMSELMYMEDEGYHLCGKCYIDSRFEFAKGITDE